MSYPDRDRSWSAPRITYAVLLSFIARQDISDRYILSIGRGRVLLQVQPPHLVHRELDRQRRERRTGLREQARADQRERRERLGQDVREGDLDRQRPAVGGELAGALQPPEVVLA